MHLTDGLLQSYFDGEVTEDERSRIDTHLEGCLRCMSQYEEIRRTTESVTERLSVIEPTVAERPMDVRQAHHHLVDHMVERERNAPMLGTLLRKSNLRPAAVFALLAIILIALAFPPVRAIASSFLGLFRVEQIAVVEVNPANLPEQLGSSATLDQMLATDVVVVDRGEPARVETVEEAGELAGFRVRLPASNPDPQVLWVQPGSRITYQVDPERLKLLLQEIERPDIEVPSELANADITLDVPASVSAGYGQCDFETHFDGDPGARLGRQHDCMILLQMPSPTISAPPGLDIAQIGTAFLEVMGMTPEEAARFSETIDWATTLVIPIPRNGIVYEELQVDGVKATLVQQVLADHPPQFMLLWVKNGIVYSLTGTGQGEDHLAFANGLE